MTSCSVSAWTRYRRVAVTLALGLLAGVASLASSDEIGLLDGLVYDLSLAVSPQRPGTAEQPVSVIALDRDSLESDELAPLPRVFLGPVWAKVLAGLKTAEARAVGFDIIFSYSANQFPGFEGQFDRDFLAALAASRDRVVLARSARSYPAPPFVAAVFDPRTDAGKEEPAAIGYAELTPDADGVFRHAASRVPTAEGQPLPTLAATLLDRARGVEMPERVLLAPRRSLEATPVFRLVDVLHCLERDPAAIRQAFGGKVVLIGTTLPEEDRKRSPDRFMPAAGLRADTGSGCRMDRLGASDPESDTIPGMFIHAAAIESVLTGNLVHPVSAPVRAAAAGLAGMAGSALGFALAPLLAVVATGALMFLCLAAAPLLLGAGWWFAPVLPAAAAGGSMAVAYVVRFVIEDRRRRRVQHAFGHYLAPAIVGQLLDSEAPLRLGGEEREVTIMFADLSGFTALSGKVGPAELMAVTNSYLALIVEAVEATGGYIDKFIGDAVMGIWGAPAPDPDHAASAATAALAAVAAVMNAKAQADAEGRHGYSVKIGLNSGPAVVGNVGAAQRYNYTAVGETVNVAARLESVPGDYGCRIVVGPATAAAIKDRFVINELDWIKVKGKEAPLAVYELVATRAAADAAMLSYPERYHAALQLYRAGDFAAAEKAWRETAAHPFLSATAPPVVMAERAAELAKDPPSDWDGVHVKTSK